MLVFSFDIGKARVKEFVKRGLFGKGLRAERWADLTWELLRGSWIAYGLQRLFHFTEGGDMV